MKHIYLDNSATTPIDPSVLKAMSPFLNKDFGNPHSIHSFGQTAQAAVDEAREKIARHFNCSSQEIIFTSGATESNNLAIAGVVNALLKNKKPIHIITTKIEHPSVLEVFRALEKWEDVEVSYLDVDASGVIKIEQLKKSIKENTVLVSIMYANNEVGAIQPIKEIGGLINNERLRRRSIRASQPAPIYFHVDAVQAMNYLTADVQLLGADLISISGHKIYGPKGVGSLFVKRGVRLEPLVLGGHQEYGLRSGTLNVPGIVGLGKAVEMIDVKTNAAHVIKIKNKLLAGIKKISDIRLNGAGDMQLPNIVNVSFKNAEGESVLMMLDLAGIAISTGSACAAGSLEPSHVLTAMGVAPEWSHGSIRISIGKFNTETDATAFVKAIMPIVEKLRKMAP
ncbi:MAG: cysteine desulfurase family protein [Parcubacteria group bacterium]